MSSREIEKGNRKREMKKMYANDIETDIIEIIAIVQGMESYK